MPDSTASKWSKLALGRVVRAVDTMKQEYRKGRSGDTSPVEPIAPSIVPALRKAVGLLRTDPSTAQPPTEDEAAEVAEAVRHIDWKQVSASLRDNRVTQQMKDLAADVDWAKAKPAAARLGTVIIAAAASGQLGPLAGPKTTLVARTLVDTGLADKVAAKLSAEPAETPDRILDYIDATATDARDESFEANLAGLGRALGPGE